MIFTIKIEFLTLKSTTHPIAKPARRTQDIKKKFCDWNMQIELVQFTRDLKEDAKIDQGNRLPFKVDRGLFEHQTRTQATMV